MNEKEKCYWAGLFDGEGCISIRLNRPTQTSRHKTNLYALITKVTMCDKELVKQMQKSFGIGHLTINQRQESLRVKQRPALSWTCMSNDAMQVIIILKPYLRSKLNEAKIALDFMSLPSARRGRRRTDPELTKKREDLYYDLRKAKGRL